MALRKRKRSGFSLASLGYREVVAFSNSFSVRRIGK